MSTTKELFEKYELLTDQITTADAVVKELQRQRSDMVKTILDQEGNVPLKWKGKTLRIAKRQDTYFFKGQSNNAKEIE